MGGWRDRLVREGDERMGGGMEGLGMAFEAVLCRERGELGGPWGGKVRRQA